jgi:hypothetical protein
MARVVFLDMDGVCCSERTALALGDHRVDPVAIEFLNRLYRAAPFHLVASSSWRDDFYVPIIMKAVGCVAPFADAWKTEDGVPRSEAISDWLSVHMPNADYLIIDDEDHVWTPDQSQRWARCDPQNGITVQAMRYAFSVFKAAQPEEAHCELNAQGG